MACERQAATEACFRTTKAGPLTLCLAENWDEDYAKSEYGATHGEASSKPESELAWPAGPRVDDSNLFLYDKLLTPETGVDLVVSEWHGQ